MRKKTYDMFPVSFCCVLTSNKAEPSAILRSTSKPIRVVQNVYHAFYTSSNNLVKSLWVKQTADRWLSHLKSKKRIANMQNDQM